MAMNKPTGPVTFAQPAGDSLGVAMVLAVILAVLLAVVVLS